MKRARAIIAGSVVLMLVGSLAWGAVGLGRLAWTFFTSADPSLAAGILAAATTILVSTATVVFGRYYERKRDLEAAYREKKTEIYDAFLQELFRVLQGTAEGQVVQNDLVAFLREWQRKVILWGDQRVVSSYVDLMRRLRSPEPDARAVFALDKFFRAIRKDLGHSSVLLPQGTFAHLILREGDLFLAAAKKNPNITLSELAELENGRR